MSIFIILFMVFLSVIGYGNYKSALNLSRQVYCDINGCEAKNNECDFLNYKN